MSPGVKPCLNCWLQPKAYLFETNLVTTLKSWIVVIRRVRYPQRSQFKKLSLNQSEGKLCHVRQHTQWTLCSYERCTGEYIKGGMKGKDGMSASVRYFRASLVPVRHPRKSALMEGKGTLEVVNSVILFCLFFLFRRLRDCRVRSHCMEDPDPYIIVHRKELTSAVSVLTPIKLYFLSAQTTERVSLL